MLKVNTKKISIGEFAKKYNADSYDPRYKGMSFFGGAILILPDGTVTLGIALGIDDQEKEKEAILDLLFDMIRNGDLVKE